VTDKKTGRIGRSERVRNDRQKVGIIKKTALGEVGGKEDGQFKKGNPLPFIEGKGFHFED
jgi:hypothetical protein